MNTKIFKVNDLDKYVIFSISVLLTYTLINISLECADIHLSDVLTTCVYGAFGGEILWCALIKIFKLKGDKNEESS